jgi:hypothetical protein
LDLPYGSWEAIKAKTNFTSRSLVLEMCVGLSLRVPGNIIEFGVAHGGSTRVIRQALSRFSHSCEDFEFHHKQIFALDSFEGLRERYENVEAGHFACDPPQIDGVEIVRGYFEDTLTPEFAGKVGRVAFAHLDADLYTSTACALNFLTPLLNSGSLLLFDQYTSGGGQEKRAFEEWLQKTRINTLPIAEFARDPSGGGQNMDKRVVYQILGEKDLPHASSAEPLDLSAKAVKLSYITRPDILPLNSSLRLTNGWYTLEEYGGETFRWVNNDAEIALQNGGITLSMELEPGPGAGGLPLLLNIIDSEGVSVDRFDIRHRQVIRFAGPARADDCFRLHVNGGGVPAPSDSRILNFRVFRFTIE